MRNSTIIGVIVAIVVLLVIGLAILSQALYTVDVTEQTLNLRFGEVKATRIQPGLYWKTPFAENALKLDKRILRIDAPPVAMPDREKQNLIIDSYARYRIVDPVQFRRTLQTETGARSRLGDIVTSTMRDQVALRDRFEIIGSRPVLDEGGNPVADGEGLPHFEGTETRTELMDEVLAEVRTTVATQNFGIEIVDVRIKRVNFPDQVTPSIYTRMRAERNRIATRFRAEGEEEDLKIRAGADRDRDIILAEAQRQANMINSDTEARIIDSYIQALAGDTRLSRYQESLKALKISKGLIPN